uniref:Uncharacterized protein MANES_15G090100 n=1 Tax=Rhizophora mucronata TaxID=61149 RepID=A0A2P2JQW9_RHIMU
MQEARCLWPDLGSPEINIRSSDFLLDANDIILDELLWMLTLCTTDGLDSTNSSLVPSLNASAPKQMASPINMPEHESFF